MLRSNLVRHRTWSSPPGPLSLSSFGKATRASHVDHPVPLEDFVSYGLWVTGRAVPDVDRRNGLAADRGAGGRFRLDLADGARSRPRARWWSPAGSRPSSTRPAGYAHLPPERIIHTADHSDLSVFAGRRVAVVGGGQSAFECAALMVGARRRRRSRCWSATSASCACAGAPSSRARAPRAGRLRAHRRGPAVVQPARVEKPDVALPPPAPRCTQDRIAQRCIRPACSHFVRVRLDGVRLTHRRADRRSRRARRRPAARAQRRRARARSIT